MATTATVASSSSSTSTAGGIGVEETVDEVKVFRSSTQEDDPNELAGSSADLNADKQELAMEADIESQADFSQRVNPIFSPLGPLPWPSPGNNFLYNLAALSPVFHQKLATMAMAQTYAAAAANCIARLSPHYMNLGGGGGLGAFERPPAFSMPCTPSTNGTARNGGGQQQSGPNPLQMNSPMSGLSGGLGGVSLSADRATNGHQRQNHQNQHPKTSNTNRTPKREKAERKEKPNAKSGHDKKEEHIKKPMNAFMLFMKENRHKYMEECGGKRKQSAELNKELGQIWQKLSKDEQQPYYDKAQMNKEQHQKLYPNWTARENYAIHKRVKKRRTRERSLENNEQKKCRARFGVDNQAKWCKHCRRKKRCLNVRDADSPVQVSSTTNPTTPLSLAGPSNAAGFNHLIGMFASSQSQDSPHSSRKDCGQSTSELSRCSSTTSSTTSNMSADEGLEGQQNVEKEKMAQQNCFKLELLEAPKTTTGSSQPTTQIHNELPKPVPNMPNGFPMGAPHPQLNGATAPLPNASPFQMTPAPQQLGFQFPPQLMMPYFMPNFMKQ